MRLEEELNLGFGVKQFLLGIIGLVKKQKRKVVDYIRIIFKTFRTFRNCVLLLIMESLYRKNLTKNFTKSMDKKITTKSNYWNFFPNLVAFFAIYLWLI